MVIATRDRARAELDLLDSAASTFAHLRRVSTPPPLPSSGRGADALTRPPGGRCLALARDVTKLLPHLGLVGADRRWSWCR
jgi:hypothetical protein